MQTAAMLVSQNMGYLFTSPVFLGMQMEYLASKIVYCTMKGMPDTRKIVAVYQPDTCKKENGRTVYRASAHSRPSGEAGTVSAFGMSFRQKNDFVLSVYQFQTQN